MRWRLRLMLTLAAFAGATRPRSGQARDCGPARCAGPQHDGADDPRKLSPLVSGETN